MSELIQIENLNAIEIFKVGGIDAILKTIESEVVDFIPDISTDKGRKEIASRAYKVAQSKTAIDAAGKKLADELNAQLSPINGERKKARDFLDNLKDKVREPLTVWEEKEKSRKGEILRAIKQIKDWFLSDDIHELEMFFEFNENLCAEFFEEYKEEGDRACAEALPLIEEKIKFLKKQKADAEELERLRLAEATRLQKEREQEIARQASERAEREKNEAIARAEKERLEAIERAKQVAEQAEKDKQNAVIAERERIERAEKERFRLAYELARDKEEHERKRAQDIEYRRRINGQIIEDFKSIGLSEDYAKEVIKAICNNKISHMSINY
jgi:colicin import membrane protein